MRKVKLAIMAVGAGALSIAGDVSGPVEMGTTPAYADGGGDSSIGGGKWGSAKKKTQKRKVTKKRSRKTAAKKKRAATKKRPKTVARKKAKKTSTKKPAAGTPAGLSILTGQRKTALDLIEIFRPDIAQEVRKIIATSRDKGRAFRALIARLKVQWKKSKKFGLSSPQLEESFASVSLGLDGLYDDLISKNSSGDSLILMSAAAHALYRHSEKIKALRKRQKPKPAQTTTDSKTKKTTDVTFTKFQATAWIYARMPYDFTSRKNTFTFQEEILFFQLKGLIPNLNPIVEKPESMAFTTLDRFITKLKKTRRSKWPDLVRLYINELDRLSKFERLLLNGTAITSNWHLARPVLSKWLDALKEKRSREYMSGFDKLNLDRSSWRLTYKIAGSYSSAGKRYYSPKPPEPAKPVLSLGKDEQEALDLIKNLYPVFGASLEKELASATQKKTGRIIALAYATAMRNLFVSIHFGTHEDTEKMWRVVMLMHGWLLEAGHIKAGALQRAVENDKKGPPPATEPPKIEKKVGLFIILLDKPEGVSEDDVKKALERRVSGGLFAIEGFSPTASDGFFLVSKTRPDIAAEAINIMRSDADGNTKSRRINALFKRLRAQIKLAEKTGNIEKAKASKTAHENLQWLMEGRFYLSPTD